MGSEGRGWLGRGWEGHREGADDSGMACWAKRGVQMAQSMWVRERGEVASEESRVHRQGREGI